MHSKQSVRLLDKSSLDDDIENLINLDDSNRKSIHRLSSSGKQTVSQTSDTDSSSGNHKRDEVQEIRNRSRNEDRRVRLWSSVLLLVILTIGSSVSGLTYHFLRKEETKAMNIAVGYQQRRRHGSTSQHSHYFLL